MIKKSFLSILLLAGVLIQVSAQYDAFNISKYKLPDIRTRSLDLQMYINHSYQDIKRTGAIDQEYNTNTFNGNLQLSLNHFRNSEKYQGSHTLSVNYTPYYNKESDSFGSEKNNSNSASFNFTSVNRFYNSSIYFLEVLPDLYYSPFISSSVTEAVSEKNIRHYFTIKAPVSAGWGRIEPVRDARLAVYILDELAKHGKIGREPDETEILRLAGEISKIKKKRFFDSRIRKIEELQTIDSFLVAGSIIDSGDIIYFTCLNDQWDYASGPERYSGFSVNFGFNNKINIAVDWTESKGAGEPVTSTVRLNEYTVGAFSQLRYSKPLNLRWQSDLTVRLPYDRLITRDPSEPDGINNYNTHRLQPSLDYSVQYLPDSRTSAGLTTGGYYRYIFGERKLYDNISGTYIFYDGSEAEYNWYASFGMYYYISPRLRLAADWSLYMRYVRTVLKPRISGADDINNYKNLYDYLNVRLIYSFF